jgi:choline kinase
MLAICVPVRDTVHSAFAFCLAQLASNLTHNNIRYQLFFEVGSLIADQRYRLVNTALERTATEILWLDSDMIFPADVYQKLSKWNHDVVACMYSTRTKPYRSTAFLSDNMQDTLTARSGIHSVYAVGMGCMLTKTQVFKIVPQPWFNTRWDYQNNSFSGEDIYFCDQLQNYNYQVFVDCDLSNQCSHIGTTNIKLENINV